MSAPEPTVTVVIPAAGEGRRFIEAGYARPKAFIDVLGRPMIEWVVDNVAVPGARFLIIGRATHLATEAQSVARLAKSHGVQVHALAERTEGTACTILAARDAIPPHLPLLIANSDQLVQGGVQAMLEDAARRQLDGSILVFRDDGNPKWSFARVNDEGWLEEVAEKRPISPLATVGIYWFARAELFFSAAEAMIAADDRVNGEFYTCPVYNYLRRQTSRIGVYELLATAMHGLGTPEDLQHFVTSGAAAFAAAGR